MPKQKTRQTKKLTKAKPAPKKPKAKVSYRVKHQAEHWFIPTAHNCGRPRLTRSVSLIAILVLVIVVQFIYQTTTHGRVLGERSDITSTKLLALTNTARAENDKSTLIYNDQLAHAAELKANDMFTQQYWDHNAPDGTRPWKWLTVADYTYEEAGENLARGFDSASAIIDAWMDSPSHRKNVLKDIYAEVGFAAVDGVLGGKHTTLVVALYAKPAETAVIGATTEPDMTLGSLEGSSDLWTELRRGFQSATPSLIFLLTLLSVAAAVALLAHVYRKYLPPNLRKSWYRHHAIYKLAFIAILAIGAIMSYGGGMI